MSPELSIVVFTRDDADHLGRCLESLASDRPDVAFEVVIFDNDSKDDTAEVVASFGERLPVRTILSHRDTSFSAGNNKGWMSSDAPLLLFLNPDTVVNAAAIEACVELLRRDPGVGAISPRLRYPDGEHQPTGWYLPTLRHLALEALRIQPREVAPDPGGVTAVGWVMGCFVATKREVLLEVGGWDNGFWFHGTDLELCAKIRRHGRTVLRLEEHEIVHVGHRAWDAERLRAVRRAHQLWLLRDYGPAPAALYGALAGLKAALRR